MLKDKLSEWLDTEDDDEVKVQVRSALDSLTKVRAAKQNTKPRTVSVPLGMLVKEAVVALNQTLPSQSFLAKVASHKGSTAEPKKIEGEEPGEAKEAEHVLASLHHVMESHEGSESEIHVSIIKESF